MIHETNGHARRLDIAAVEKPAPACHPWRHSADYRTVHWNGQRFRFSKTQAAVLEALDHARSDVEQAELLRAVGSEAGRLIELFRRGDGARAWGTLIVAGDFPGSYRLAVVAGTVPTQPEQPDAVARLERQVRRLRRELRRRQPDGLAVVVQLVEALKGLMAQPRGGAA